MPVEMGGGSICPTLTGDHQNRVTDYTAIVVEETMTYQNVTGPLMANAHPGSYCGQDAYSDMLITGGNNVDHGNGTGECEIMRGGVQH